MALLNLTFIISLIIEFRYTKYLKYFKNVIMNFLFICVT